MKSVIAAFLFLATALHAPAQLLMPARQVSVNTNGWGFLFPTGATAQATFDYLDWAFDFSTNNFVVLPDTSNPHALMFAIDDALAATVLDGSSWSNFPTNITTPQGLFNWLDSNWVFSIVAAMTNQFPYLDTDYRNDITGVAFDTNAAAVGFGVATNPAGVVTITVPTNLLLAAGTTNATVATAFFDAVGVVTQSLSAGGYADVTNYITISTGSVGTFAAGVLTFTNAGTYLVQYQGIVLRDGTGDPYSVDPYISFSGNPHPGTYAGASANFRALSPSENGLLASATRAVTNGETVVVRVFVEEPSKMRSSRLQASKLHD